MIKLIFTDYDGSYADQGGKVLPSTRKLKEKLQKRGIIISLVSGRSVKEVKRFVKKENFSPIFIAELGTVIYFKRKEIINHGNLNKYKESKNFLDLLKKTNSHDAMFKIGAVDLILEKAKKREEKLLIFTPKDGRPGDKKNNIMNKKGTVLLRGNVDLKVFNNLLLNHFPFLEMLDNGFIEIINSDGTRDHAYHLIIKGANKCSAAKIIQKKLNCFPGETIAIGDSSADLALVQISDKFILVRNPGVNPKEIIETFKEKLEENKAQKLIKKIIITKEYGSLGWAKSLKTLSL